jgi:2-alkenal reductase
MERKMNKKLILPVMILVLSSLACQIGSVLPTQESAAPIPTLPGETVPVDLSSQQDRLVSLYQNVNPGVVAIKTANAIGSGWVYSADGYIVTNAHVVDADTRVEVDFPSGNKVYGEVVGTDGNSDLAVVRVDPAGLNLVPLPLGDSSTLQVGQIVIAIGNPFGYSSTMTSGIVSAVGRSMPSSAISPGGNTYSSGDLIQTDTALNPGNSGGPLLNLNGEVVGVNRAIRTSSYTDTGEPVNSGIGFAISVNTVKRVVPSLIANGRFDYPYLGISAIDDLPLDVIDSLDLQSQTGAYVTGVVPGGPSEQAGLTAGSQTVSVPGYGGSLYAGGDLIVAVDGQQVFTFDDLIRYLILNKAPGEVVTLTVWRGDQQLEIPVTLAARP